jgi:hypothetical protein
MRERIHTLEKQVMQEIVALREELRSAIHSSP